MKRIVILTGAGISAESGVPTFRDAGGLWEGHAVEEVATPEAFAKNPSLVHKFYNQRRADLPLRAPNPAHQAIAKLQCAFPRQVTLITQNVDDLHERAGSAHVLHMHGELTKIRCVSCLNEAAWLKPLFTETACPACQTTGVLRPHIVWFGEVPFYMDEIQLALQEAELFVAIGTSGQVYPAAAFVDAARMNDAMTVEFNVQTTAASIRFDETRTGPASITVPAWVEELMASQEK